MCNANIIRSFCWYLGGYIYTNRAWLFAMPYYIFAWLVHLRGCSCLSCTNRTVGATAWLVHLRGCSCPNCTNRTIGTTAWLVHLRQVHPLKAPPERLLHEHFLHLAVSRANDVQTLLELRKLNAVNSEECCCALSYGCSVDAGL